MGPSSRDPVFLVEGHARRSYHKSQPSVWCRSAVNSLHSSRSNLYNPFCHEATKQQLGIVRRGRDIATAAGPVDVNVLSDLEVVVGELGLDFESVGLESRSQLCGGEEEIFEGRTPK